MTSPLSHIIRYHEQGFPWNKDDSDEQAGVQVKAQAGAQANEQADTQVKPQLIRRRRKRWQQKLQNLLGRVSNLIPERDGAIPVHRAEHLGIDFGET